MMTVIFCRTSGALLAALLMTCVAAAQQQPAVETFKPFTLKTPEGTKKTLTDVLGKTTLVVFFFPTCGFCNAAFPEIQKLHYTYEDRGLSMVWINVVPQQERLIADWRARGGYTATILLGGRSVQKDYKLTMTPTHYLLDAGGKILWKHAGYKPGDEKDLERRIREALFLTEPRPGSE
jgi:cytochrome c biogenesis protein CcmG/thiol:disulfide interchange protein DsbE